MWWLPDGVIGKKILIKLAWFVKSCWRDFYLSIPSTKYPFVSSCHVQQFSWRVKNCRTIFKIWFFSLFFLSFFPWSAGVGRTGVLIFMETAFNMIEGAEPIFPLEIVRKMRDQRCSLIQTPVSGQFGDCYMKVALDVFVCGLLFHFLESSWLLFLLFRDNLYLFWKLY